MAIAFAKGKNLTKLIEKIGKVAGGLKADIHLACVSSALHVLEHGNTTPINDLCNHAKEVTHNNAVARWFAEYCTWVKWDSKAKAFVLKPEVRKAVLIDGVVDPAVVAEYVDTLEKAKTYAEFTPPPAFNGVNVIGMLKAIERKVAKAEAEANEVAAVDPEEAAAMLAKIDTTGLADVKALLKKLAA